jgi:pimeloyl-ACP methyl ester carboxylesterase
MSHPNFPVSFMKCLVLAFTILTGQGHIFGQWASQPLEGPGGQSYLYDTVVTIDQSRGRYGFSIFMPPRKDSRSIPVIAFLHGYGSFNPAEYGGWITHLVRKGNVVIYPTYQTNLIHPYPRYFDETASQGILNALRYLDSLGLTLDPERFGLIGHSYGAAASAYLAVYYEDLNLPKPAFVMSCQPGTGPARGLKLKSYEAMPGDIALAVVVGDRDRMVGDKLGLRMYETANTDFKLIIRHFEDDRETMEVPAGHHAPFGVDMDLDNGRNNFSIRRAFRKSRIDPVDYFVYWKLADLMINCFWYQTNCAEIDENHLSFLGSWPDGTALKKSEVRLKW